MAPLWLHQVVRQSRPGRLDGSVAAPLDKGLTLVLLGESCEVSLYVTVLSIVAEFYTVQVVGWVRRTVWNTPVIERRHVDNLTSSLHPTWFPSARGQKVLVDFVSITFFAAPSKPICRCQSELINRYFTIPDTSRESKTSKIEAEDFMPDETGHAEWRTNPRSARAAMPWTSRTAGATLWHFRDRVNLTGYWRFSKPWKKDRRNWQKCETVAEQRTWVETLQISTHH